MLKTFTTGCRKPAKKGQFLMMLYVMVGYGQRSKNCLLKRKRKSAVKQLSSKVCFKRAKAAVGKH